MVAHMNAEALRKTIESGDAWYFSRSRNALWRKGETSGHTQRVVEMRMDCDQDAVWIRVEQTGAACHTGRRSCFYRAVKGGEGGAALSFVDRHDRHSEERAEARVSESMTPGSQVRDPRRCATHSGLRQEAHPGMTTRPQTRPGHDDLNPPLTIPAAV